MLNGCAAQIRCNIGELSKLSKLQLATLRHAEELSSDIYQGRKAGTAGSLKAANYIAEQLQFAGIKPFGASYFQPFDLGNQSAKQGQNIIGVLPSANNSDNVILLTAHYDHLGSDHGGIYNGADDNASGVGALLALADEIKNLALKHQFIFLFTDEEEGGLQGAKFFTEHYANLLSKIRLVINIDMVAGDAKTRELHYLMANIESELNEDVKHAVEQLHQSPEICAIKGFPQPKSTGSIVARKIQWLQASDHWIFKKIGLPIIYYGVGEHQNYHTYQDNFANLNQPLLAHSVNVILQSIRFFDEVIS